MKKRLKSRKRASIGFSNEKFLMLLSSITGVVPVGVLGRETPLDLTSLEAARGSLLLREVFSKFDDGKPSEDKQKTTWERFHEAEQSCQVTNRTFPSRTRDPFWVSVKSRIRDVLGPFNWDECAKFFAFGPGATTRLTRAESAPAYKYSGIPESTSANAVLASCAISMVPMWKHNVLLRGGDPDNLVKVVEGNSVIAVPKNYKTDRTIAKEPCMNIYVQKGLGRVIRHRLKKVGVNLDDQTINQRAAYIGSITGELATVDLKMASDTLSFELVSYLLPNDWWYALEQCRSPAGVLPSGTKIRYQKFSSMGNGYTFELESLIFWAICQQVCCSNVMEREPLVCVYGDDLVVPSVHCEALFERISEAGFTPNPLKTFWEGPYRESCGKHYFHGHEITPFYVKKPVQELDRLFLTHNQLFRWFVRKEEDIVQRTEALTALRDLAPAKWRKPRLPDGFGDGAFIGDVDELRLDSHPYGWEFWQVKVLSRSSNELSDDLPDGQLLASLIANDSAGVTDRGLRKVSGMLPFVEYPIRDPVSGLPSRAGKYQEIPILIPRLGLV